MFVNVYGQSSFLTAIDKDDLIQLEKNKKSIIENNKRKSKTGTVSIFRYNKKPLNENKVHLVFDGKKMEF